MRRSVRSEHVLPVQVVRVGQGAAGVVGREAEVVKVLLDGDDRTERVQVVERGEVVFDLAAEDPDRVRRLEVQPPGQLGEDGRGYIRVVVSRVARSLDVERLLWARRRRIAPQPLSCSLRELGARAVRRRRPGRMRAGLSQHTGSGDGWRRGAGAHRSTLRSEAGCPR